MNKFYYENSKKSSLKKVLEGFEKKNANLNEIRSLNLKELLELGNFFGKKNISYTEKQNIVFFILQIISTQEIEISVTGTLICFADGFGFIRYAESNYLPESDNIYVSKSIRNQYLLRTGDIIKGIIKKPGNDEKYFSLRKVTEVNFHENIEERINFDDLTPMYPNKKIILGLKSNSKKYSGRIIDIVAPIGSGQRGLIVAPPRTGKTVLLKEIAHSIENNYSEYYVIVLLIDERPEEVTDFKRSVNCEVVSSTFDESAERHITLAEIVIEKAKRLVESSLDVVILLDSITRLGRSYNTFTPSSGKVLTGGVDSSALQKPKRFFGAARNTEEKGSLTIIATALIETGSRMDDVIFEEFKGTGNSELVLDRKIAENRVFPAIDIPRSGTRREDLILSKDILQKILLLRRYMNSMNSSDAISFLISKIENTKNNDEFFKIMNT